MKTVVAATAHTRVVGSRRVSEVGAEKGGIPQDLSIINQQLQGANSV